MRTKVVRIFIGDREIVCAVNASWSNGVGLAVLEQDTGLVENNEKEDSTEIFKNIGDVMKNDGHHPQSEELEEAAILKVTPILSRFLRMKID